jgi:exodeoxyribonuclease V alpha subunit
VGKLERRYPGEFLCLDGRWKIEPTYGKQFEAETFFVGQPASEEGIKRYLASELVKGIGPIYAERLVEHFGKDVLQIIRENPNRLLEVEGIGKKRAQLISKTILVEDREQRILRELSTRLMDYGLGAATVRRIYRKYGDNALDVLRNDPYRIAADIDGIGFATADKIAIKLKIPPDSPSRIRAALVYVLNNSANEGNCFLSQNELIEKTENLLNIPKEKIGSAVELIRKSGEVVFVEDKIYPFRLYLAESSSAVRVFDIVNSKTHSLETAFVNAKLSAIQKKNGIEFTKGQLDCVRKILCENPLLVLTGGPGTGKTTIIRAVVAIAKVAGWRVSLCAPTGRASVRLSESANAEASTIHRLLEYNPHSGFERGHNRPLDFELVVVDETSMVDIELFYRLLTALPEGVRLLLVGDANQLPSVGPGQVLADLIESKVVPVVELTEIHRQSASSRITREAHNILRGIPLDLRNDPSGDFFFIPEEERGKGLETVVELVSKRLPQKYGFDPKNDIQVIVPMYRGICGANALNDALREKLNPGESEPHAKFRVGDKVMQTRNDYDRWIFNGDIGTVREIDFKKNEMVVDFDKPASFALSEANDIVLAYAITIHKSQGSEMPCVVIPLFNEHFPLLERHLIYTAITRAKKLCVIVGQRYALDTAVKKTAKYERFSALAERIETLDRNAKKPAALF